MNRFRPALAVLLIAGSTGTIAPAAGQNGTAPQTIPGLESFSLPSSRPTPRVQPPPVRNATPTPSPTPRATPTARPKPAPKPAPTPVRTPSAATARGIKPAPTPRATPAPQARVPAAVPTVLPSPIPMPVTTPSPLPTEVLVPAAPQPEPAPPAPSATVSPSPSSPGITTLLVGRWPWIALAALLVLLALGGAVALLRARRSTADGPRRDDRHHELFAIGVAEAPAPSPPEPAPPPAAPPPAAPPIVPPQPGPVARAQLDIELQPRRAGTNLLSAAVEYQIVVRNSGAATATAIRLDVRLLSAGQGQDALIAALFTTPIERPLVEPFDLPPEAMVELGGMAMHPREGLEVMEVGGKALFVPVLTINLVYGRGDGANGQTARSYVIGIDRGGEAKLQPFRLDGAARMYDTVGALGYMISADA